MKLSMIKINPELDLKLLAKQFEEKGVLQVPNFFTEESAEYLYSMINNHSIWHLAYNDQSGFYESELSEFLALPEQRQQNFLKLIQSRASDHFQYCFIQYYISQAIEQGENEHCPAHEIHQFVNSESYLNFARAITGEQLISKADSYISKYNEGHFLTSHDDLHPKHDRVAACTFGMTKGWNPDWGGNLVFYDNNGNISKGYKPSFNTLNIFSIPQYHAVQMVNRGAKTSRQSILSWLMK